MSINTSPLESVPKPIFANICRYLDLKDIRSLQLTNKAVNKLFNENICKFIYYLNHPSQDRRVIEAGNNSYKILLNIDINASINIQQGHYKRQYFERFINHTDRHIVFSTETQIEVFDLLLGKKFIIKQEAEIVNIYHINPEYLVTSHKNKEEQYIAKIWDLNTYEEKAEIECLNENSLGVSKCKRYILFLDKEEKLNIYSFKDNSIDNALQLEQPILKEFISSQKNFLIKTQFAKDFHFDQEAFYLSRQVNDHSLAMFIFNLSDKSSKNILINYEERFSFRSFFKSDNVLFFIPHIGASLYRWDLGKGVALSHLDLNDINEERNIFTYHHLAEKKRLIIEFFDRIKIINLETKCIDHVLEESIILPPRTHVHDNLLITSALEGIQICNIETGEVVDRLIAKDGKVTHKILGHYLFLHSSKEAHEVRICDLRANNPIASSRTMPLGLILPEKMNLHFIGMMQNHLVIAIEAGDLSQIHIFKADSGECLKTIPIVRCVARATQFFPENGNYALLNVVQNSILIKTKRRTYESAKLVTEMLHFGMMPNTSLETQNKETLIDSNNKN